MVPESLIVCRLREPTLNEGASRDSRRLALIFTTLRTISGVFTHADEGLRLTCVVHDGFILDQPSAVGGFDITKFPVDGPGTGFGFFDRVLGFSQLLLDLRQDIGVLAELRLYGAQEFPELTGPLLYRQRAKAHLKAI